MSHTPEPWKLDGTNIIAGDGHTATTFTDTSLPDRGKSRGDANAARIVAAVNAVAGITTEELKRLGVGGLGKIYADRNQAEPTP